MLRSSSRQGFTLIEMLTVMLIIAILAGIVLSVNGLVQNKAARARAEGEMKSISLAIESYKVDNGTAPRNTDTDGLDPKVDKSATDTRYQLASRYLYTALSGDLNYDGQVNANEGKNYASELFKPNILSVVKSGSNIVTAVNYIKDPFDNPYGYSTAGAAEEEAFVEAVRKNPKNASRNANGAGYNPTFDLWSTGGSTSASSAAGTDGKWIKNW